MKPMLFNGIIIDEDQLLDLVKHKGVKKTIDPKTEACFGTAVVFSDKLTLPVVSLSDDNYCLLAVPTFYDMLNSRDVIVVTNADLKTIAIDQKPE